MNVSLHIERLVLENIGLPADAGDRLQGAVILELSRLLAEGGVSAATMGGGAIARIATPAIQVRRSADSVELGGQIAGSIYGGIGR